MTPASVSQSSRPEIAQQVSGLIPGDVMSAADVAAVLAVPKSTVEDWARRGIIPSRKRGKRRFFLRWEIRDWLIAGD